MDSWITSQTRSARSLYFTENELWSRLVPDVSHPFFAEIVKRIEGELNQQGYRIFLCNAVGDGVREQEYLSMLRQNKVDGIIIATHMLETSLYESLDLPIVALDLELGESIPTVCADHEKGGRLAAQELIRSGCRCVLNVGGNMDVKTPSIRPLSCPARRCCGKQASTASTPVWSRSSTGRPTRWRSSVC